MKNWLQTWQEWALAIAGAISATWALILLVPKLLKVARELYRRLTIMVEIADTLERMDSRAEERYLRIEDALAGIIAGKRLLMDADERNAHFECDQRGHHVWGNRCWHIITGLDRDASRGTGWENGIAPEDKERVIKSWQQAMDHQRAYDETATYIDREGKRTVMRVVATPVRSATGQIVGWLGVGTPQL